MNTLTQWPPRRAGCSGDCQQGRAPCDCGLDPIDTLLRRAGTDPALPIGQDEDSEPVRLGRQVLDWIGCHFGWVSAVVAVLAVAAALLTVHFLASAQPAQSAPARAVKVMT